ncbi:hypothetical protein F3Y22_tig00113279pilonHSYRG00051 [Hibiscus syriacus]|uniref:Malectin-like domain-containing protein n=1 Tax=Hibiscus syriacus TaxID=106335 RepID=A0A6A2Y342_HIBSY|nr:hypothetical protein F3Y22_tig00113279pilonHSYRG00051 [Hibiscus syriacus]
MSEKRKNKTRSPMPSKFGMLLSFICFLFVTHTISVEAVSSYDCSSFDEPSSLESKVYGTNPGNSAKLQPCVYKKQITCPFPVFPGPNAAHFTLLKTSTASYSKCLSGDCYTVTEFCIDIVDQVLNVTFTPSPDVSDAYAFVNKIEIVPLPLNLYTREVVSLPLIGQPSYYMKNLTALEMMYRLNIGEYRYQMPTGILSSDVQIKRSLTMPAYVAPKQVYASARTVAYDGSNQTGITWLLPVDSGFYYLVRLHFCEISNEIKGVGQRVFHVYIKDQTAEDQADIFLWSHGVGVPVYRITS